MRKFKILIVSVLYLILEQYTTI